MSPPVAKKCGKCKLLIKGRAFLKCMLCELFYHIECQGYEKLYYLLDNDRKAGWECKVCLRKKGEAKLGAAPGMWTSPAPLPVPETSKVQDNIIQDFVESCPLPLLPEYRQDSSSVSSDIDAVDDPNQNVTFRKKSRSQAHVSPDDVNSSYNHGEAALDEIATSLKEYVATQMTTFTQQLFARIDTIAMSVRNLDSRLSIVETRLQQRITSIELSIDKKIDSKVSDLLKTVDRLQNELNVRDQELLLNEIEISGIPETDGENPIHIVTLISDKLGVNIAQSDVVSAVRVGSRRRRAGAGKQAAGEGASSSAPTRTSDSGAPLNTQGVHGAQQTVSVGTCSGGAAVSHANDTFISLGAPSSYSNAVSSGGGSASSSLDANRIPNVAEFNDTPTNAGDESLGPPLLVVRLLRRAQRDELLRAARVRRGADTTGLGVPGPPRRFYLNERLTRSNRLLFRRAREETRKLEWRFAWTKDGAIFVRQNHAQPAKRIRSENDLLKVFGGDVV